MATASNAQTTSNAPEVDLKSRGLPLQVRIALSSGALVVAAYYLYSGGWAAAPDSEGQPEGSEEAWSLAGLLWVLLTVAWRIAQFLVLLMLLLLVALVCRQRTILYVPVPPNMQRSPKLNPPAYRSPEQWKLPFEDVYIATADGVKINAWFVYQLESRCSGPVPTLIHFHGNAGNIGHRLENVRDMHRNLGVNLLIVDYRGYGDSEDGSGPSEEGFIRDAMASYRWLVERIRGSGPPQAARMSEDRILIFGCSIGGAVAIQLAARLLRERLAAGGNGAAALPMPAGLVLENTFTALREMAVQLFPFLKFLSPLLCWPLLFDEWRSCDNLRFLCENHKDWACCLLSGQQDEIVPPIQMKQLHSILSENRPRILKMFLFKNGGHNDTPQRSPAEYWASFKKFLDLVEEGVRERRASAAAPEMEG